MAGAPRPQPSTDTHVHEWNGCIRGSSAGDRARGGWWEFELWQWGERKRGGLAMGCFFFNFLL